MPIDVSRINLGRIIFHRVPSGPTDVAHDLVLSRIESPLNNQARNYFRQKLVSTLVNGAYPVLFDTQSTSVVPGSVLNITTAGSQHFVGDSQIMARHLYDIQNMNNGRGVFAVAEVDSSGLKAVTVVKLEHGEGARALPISYQGEPTFDVEHLQNLMLTDKTRIFKAALFAQHGTGLGDIDGLVSDNQITRGTRSGVADFFLRKFLVLQRRVKEGCWWMSGQRRGVSHGTVWLARCVAGHHLAIAATPPARTAPAAKAHAPLGTPGAG